MIQSNQILGTFLHAIGGVSASSCYTPQSIAIGISAVLGTLIPLIICDGLTDYYTRPGSAIIISGMVLSVIGVGLCGWAGFKKEKDLLKLAGQSANFQMSIGLIPAIIAGVLSAVFILSLEHGQPIADMAARNGAGIFEGNAKMIISTSGCFAVNFIWFIALGIKQKTLSEFTVSEGLSQSKIVKNTFWSALAGTLWFVQFLFYGLGHVQMGNSRFISWVLHMSMLIFYSFGIGVIMKEWKQVSKNTFTTLVLALPTLVISFVVMTLGSYLGEQVN